MTLAGDIWIGIVPLFMKPTNQKVAITTADDSGIKSKLKSAKPRIVIGLIMSITMAAVLSLVLTISYVGFSSDFLSIWLHRLGISLLVGPPISIVILPVVMKMAAKILKTSLG